MESRSFVTHYAPAFVWVGLAIYTFVIFALVLLGRSPRGDINSTLASLLIISFLAAAYRAFKGGFRLERHREGLLMSIAANLWSLIVGTLIWPFFELFRQGRFLLKARTHWQRGEILVDERGRELRAG